MMPSIPNMQSWDLLIEVYHVRMRKDGTCFGHIWSLCPIWDTILQRDYKLKHVSKSSSHPDNVSNDHKNGRGWTCEGKSKDSRGQQLLT